ncbi:hypothetical protein C0993_007032 [Termitomyces sp. T159_Od127]|nr:hypothetical protein C0993_007032 [Termitomyces sp. T159_Od127]
MDSDGARRATNRLSGFLASLVHRPPRPAPAVDAPPAPPALRPATPPPALPAPTLHELGLSLSVLGPAHSSPGPTSGAFLAPHFLLLCHAQGLDVLSLASPPAPQPFALVRRVPFKSVVVMEQRGVLVAIAGRRDGVRVYALDDIRKAIAWRIDHDARRERDRSRRDKKPAPPTKPALPLRPRSPTPRRPRLTPAPSEPPPPYASPLDLSHPPRLHRTKSEWPESSDDEAINIVAAEASGSQALDERTSATSRPQRPSDLDLDLTRTATVVPSEPSPVPTLLTLRQALSATPRTPDQNTPSAAADDDDPDDDDGLTLAQILSESRLPGLPPAGTRQPQQPILLSPNEPGRRRRWSALLGTPGHLSRSQSFQSSQSHDASPTIPSSSTTHIAPSIVSSQSSRSSRFIPRILSSAFVSRKPQDRPPMPEIDKKSPPPTPVAPQAPPPKQLEYVKLPGTKGALMIKAVETAKKSFLAILCGENGEKVELFAGTYRTALGLSRTFILPDSPRSLELQLQGDDLVEVFLVFSQNVFGLEPATVRVREVRIGRAERRAARRRAREIRAGDAANNDSEPVNGEEDTNVSVSIGVSVAVGSTVVATGDGADTLIPNEHPCAQQDAPDSAMTSTIAQSEELVAVATAQMGPYTTFQQLSFAPNFPLASIADEYIIPPTYPSFLEYRAEHEPEERSTIDLQFTPPGLPVPVPTAPSRWYYRDPRSVIHGPWKASLMQAWYKDGLLPLDLPVRREEDKDFILLQDLRLHSVDPTHPFRAPPPPASSTPAMIDAERPLLKPISLLAQPRHFGPPALFFSSRGGHSTAIVDARGRSVLKGRFVWSSDAQHDDDDDEAAPALVGRMGDIKRLEALDVDDRSVLVAMRQGGLEAVDLSDALLRPADESRTVLPQFAPPVFNINRRAPFVWKIGMPVASSSSSAAAAASVLAKGKASSSYNLSGKKPSGGTMRSPAVRSEFALGDGELDSYEEVLFLGRKDDEIYLCERNTGSYRILRLCPALHSGYSQHCLI